MAKQESHSIDDVIAVAKALGDEGRVRVLALLKDGELCLCQIIDILGLAPSTVSKHMSILRQAGLIEQRKEGRWHYYRLTGTMPTGGRRNGPTQRSTTTPLVKQAMRWVMNCLDREPTVTADAKRLCCIQKMNREDLTKCYRAPKTIKVKAVTA